MAIYPKRSPSKAIRIFCIECRGESFQGVTECADTACPFYPYWQEKPVTVIMPNPDYNPDLVAKLAALRETRAGCCKNAGTLIHLIMDNPQATVAELAAMLKN